MPQARRSKFLAVVDDTPEFKSALHYCCRRAQNTGGRVILLRVIAPADFQHWNFVGDLMRQEAEEEATLLLDRWAEEALKWTEAKPETAIREGDSIEQILALIDEDPDIRILVLGASASKEGPGPLVRSMADQVSGQLKVPLIIVPGKMTAEEIDAVT